MKRSVERSIRQWLGSTGGDGHWSMLISPHLFYRAAGWLVPAFVAAALLLGALGVYVEFALTPQAGATVSAARIVFIHEPVAWMSLIVLVWMAFWGAVWLAFRFRLSRMLLFALAPTGALFAFLALWTGTLWGKPVWGTWWLWDARLTSELVLLLLYAGIIGLHALTLDSSKADDAASVLSLAGVIAVPLLYCAVYLTSATQAAAFVGLSGRSEFAPTAQVAMGLMTLSFWSYTFATSFARARTIILERERDSDWATRIAAADR